MTDTTHLRKRCEVAQQCLPDAPYRKQLEALHTELLGTIELLIVKNKAFARAIDSLNAEVLAMTAELDALASAIGNEQLAKFVEKYGEPIPLVKERDALKADAERLDWLCENLVEGCAIDAGELDIDNLRAQIDAAIKKEKPC